jgi:hypothetical protein
VAQFGRLHVNCTGHGEESRQTASSALDEVRRHVRIFVDLGRVASESTDEDGFLDQKPLEDDVPYTTQALRQDLTRVRTAWNDCQMNRNRDAIYSYLTAVFDLVALWVAENRAISRARWALQLQRLDLPTTDEPFAAVILCTADRQKVNKRTRSKWSRVLRYAAEYKSNSEPLAAFVQRKGGINKCAARFTRCLGRRGRN